MLVVGRRIVADPHRWAAPQHAVIVFEEREDFRWQHDRSHAGEQPGAVESAEPAELGVESSHRLKITSGSLALCAVPKGAAGLLDRRAPVLREERLCLGGVAEPVVREQLSARVAMRPQ